MSFDHLPGHLAWAGTLFQRDFGWLRNRLQRRTQCPHDAEDFAAEAFLRLLHLPDPGAVREPRALLTTIAKRVMYESWRRADLERAYLESLALIPLESQPSAEEQYMLIEALIYLDQLLDGLPRRSKAAFIHYQFGGLNYREIAEALGVSVPMVHQYMVKAYSCCLQALESV